jgi:NAD(P)H-flavin reductase
MANPVKIKAKVLSINTFGSDTYVLTLKPYSNIPRYKAGQFLHLSIDAFDPTDGFWPESRVFSIASATNMSEIEIIYSVKGSYTTRMAEVLAPGYEVWLKLPYGNFIIDSLIKPKQDVVIIAGGTGISPFLPFFYELLTRNNSRDNKISLYYGIRSNALLLARHLLENCALLDNMQISICIENEPPDEYLNTPYIKKMFGRLDIIKIFNEAQELNDPVFFLSGPPQMIFNFKSQLLQHGVSQENIKIDEWE